MTTNRPGRGRRRDRHGRGLRGLLVPAEVPLSRSRARRFDELVLDAVEHLEDRWSEQLSKVEFIVEDVPPPPSEAWSDDPVPLGRAVHPVGRTPPRIVVYRRPIEARAGDPAALADLIHDVVVEEVARLLGQDPDVIDPPS